MGLVSSRLGQDLDRHKSWFAVLRTACMRLDPQQDLLVTAGTTAAQRFVQRCGQLFGLRALSIEIDREDTLSWRGWGRRVLASIGGESGSGLRTLISPPLRVTASRRSPSMNWPNCRRRTGRSLRSATASLHARQA